MLLPWRIEQQGVEFSRIASKDNDVLDSRLLHPAAHPHFGSRVFAVLIESECFCIQGEQTHLLDKFSAFNVHI